MLAQQFYFENAGYNTRRSVTYGMFYTSVSFCTSLLSEIVQQIRHDLSAASCIGICSVFVSQKDVLHEFLFSYISLTERLCTCQVSIPEDLLWGIVLGRANVPGHPSFLFVIVWVFLQFSTV